MSTEYANEGSSSTRTLDIDIPEARYYRTMPVFFHPFVVASRPSRTRASRGFGGGRVG